MSNKTWLREQLTEAKKDIDAWSDWKRDAMRQEVKASHHRTHDAVNLGNSIPKSETLKRR